MIINSSSTERQVLMALVSSLRLLLVSFALVVVIVALFAKAVLSLVVVVLTAFICLCSWMIGCVALSDDVRRFAAFLSEVHS